MFGYSAFHNTFDVKVEVIIEAKLVKAYLAVYILWQGCPHFFELRATQHDLPIQNVLPEGLRGALE